MAKEPANKRLVFILPWLNLSTGYFGVKQVAIGKAIFLPDEDATWTEKVGKPRPSYLDIFRQFPSTVDPTKDPEVARGTVLIADDDVRLQANVQLAVALLYVLGQPFDRWQTPAERFRYFGFRASEEPPDVVSLLTKKGELWEDRTSLKLYPPLELRGANTQYRVDVHEARNKALTQRFEKNPNDRLVVAARHLFRTQFADVFASPWDQDHAAYCACLEAALNVGEEDDADHQAGAGTAASADAPNQAGGGSADQQTQPPQQLRDIGKVLAKRLVEKYPDLKDMPDWIEGLYACRVIFVHGLSGDSSFRERQKKLRDVFLLRRGNHLVLRSFCLDLIREQLERPESETDRIVRQMLNSHGIHQLLEGFFNSDQLWHAIREHLSVDKAADKISRYDEKHKSDYFRDCLRYVHDHRWRFMQSPPQHEHVFRVLTSLALLITKSGQCSDDDRKVVEELGNAIDQKDTKAITAWVRQHQSWKEFDGSHLIGVCKPVMLHTARYFQ